MSTHPSQPNRRRRRRDSGATLVEVLVSVILLGTAGAAVLTALVVAVRASAVHREVADAQSWLASAGDALVDVPPQASDNYLDCATHSTADIIAGYQGVVDAMPGPPAVSVVDVEFWDSSVPGSESFGAACRYSLGDRMQRITLRATFDGAPRTLDVVKRPALDQTVNTLAPPTTLGGGNVVPEPNPLLNP